jgi:flagellar biosynthesis protein FliR
MTAAGAAMTPDGLARAAAALAVGAARAVPVAWLATPLGGGVLPAMSRVALGLLLAALAGPTLDATLAGALPAPLALTLGREVLVGMSLGLVVSFAFRAAEAAGRLTDVLRGANVAEVLAPGSEERTSPLGALYLLLAVVVFLELGGLARIAEALARSYDAVPVGGALDAVGAGRAALVVIAASAKLIESGLALAAPAVVAFWITDLALALVARAAPQLPVTFLGLPLKGLLGVGIVLLGLGTLEGALARGMGTWLVLLARAASAWAH